jgi:hypothetical protein
MRIEMETLWSKNDRGRMAGPHLVVIGTAVDGRSLSVGADGRSRVQVERAPGRTRLVLDRPFTGRLPAMHRLDLSLERGFDIPAGRLTLQGGAINAYDRRNMFFYDLYTGRRVDQLRLVPYAALTLRSR